MRLNVPNHAFIVTQQVADDGKTSIHIGNADAGPVAELILYPGQHVEVSRDGFVYQHICRFGAEELCSDPAQKPVGG
jgi:hypothetical protein